jgi:hypothetical protein
VSASTSFHNSSRATVAGSESLHSGSTISPWRRGRQPCSTRPAITGFHQREEPVAIGHPVDHEPCETIRGVEDDEASLGLGCRHVDARREQSVTEERAY